MSEGLFSEFKSYNLNELINTLNNRYYKTLEEQCVIAGDSAREICELDNHLSLTEYATICSGLFEVIKEHMKYRQGSLVSYVGELFAKHDEGHDCSNCSGKCAVGHNTHLASIHSSHNKVGEILKQINDLTSPYGPTQSKPLAYSMLRNELAVIDTLLTEMYYLEEINLLPAIIHAKTSINA